MQKEKAGEAPANEKTTPANYTDMAAIPQGWRIVEYLKKSGTIHTLEGRGKLGIPNVSQRIGELIAKYKQPIKKSWIDAPDETGAVHRVRLYIWCGESASQSDLFKG